MTAGRAPMRRLAPVAPYLAEFAGVAILLVVGLSAVAVDFAAASPVPGWIPSPIVRRLITGSIFAGTGTLVVYSVLGRISGGHLNPAMTLAFLHLGKVTPRVATGYIAAQVGGALAGAAIVRLALGNLAASVSVGATAPGPNGPLVAFAAEAVLAFALVSLVLWVMVRPAVARYTGLLAGVLVACLVTLEAPISGTSLNPARSLGPAVIAGAYGDLWIYLLAPPLGALAAAWLFTRLAPHPIPCAKLFHTDEYACHFPDCAYQAQSRVPTPLGLRERPDAQPQEARS